MKLTPQEAKVKTREQMSQVQQCEAMREKPWRETVQMSLTTGKPYRGNNQAWLKAVKEYKGYKSNTRTTFLTLQKYGARVLAGEKATHTIYWDHKTVIKEVPSKTKPGQTEKQVIQWRHPYVHNQFNLDQTTLELPVEDIPQWKVQGIETAEDLIRAYTDCPPKFRNSSEAYYAPKKKEIHLPPRELFKTLEDAYHVEFHEEGHSSGDEDKLNRPGVTGVIKFGSPAYQHEEIVAEVSALIRSTLCGIDLIISDKSLAYIKGWRKDENISLSKAFNEAETAVDRMLKGVKKDLITTLENSENQLT